MSFRRRVADILCGIVPIVGTEVLPLVSFGSFVFVVIPVGGCTRPGIPVDGVRVVPVETSWGVPCNGKNFI